MRRIESHMIAGPAGNLESLLEEPEDRAPAEAAVVCHPHPQHGGTMHNKVVYRLARALRSAGAVVLRFNYRGVNLSEGRYDHGVGEVEDARAALAWLRERYPDLPYTLAGFSFGARVALRLGCQLGDARRVIAAGFPATGAETGYFENCAVPRIFVQSTNDEYGPKPQLERVTAKLTQPVAIHWVEATDHFFAGGLDQFEEVVGGLP